MTGQLNKASWQDPKSERDLLIRYVELFKSLLSDMNLETLERIGNLIDDTSLKGNKVFCLGNGGSAATASHLSTDLFFGRRMNGEQRPKAISLVANVPLLTALSNDVGYEEVFVEQLNGLFQTGDVVFGISASGNSRNVLKAVDFARENGGISIGLVGFDGGELKSKCDISLHVETPPGAYELVEDVHHGICHMLANLLKFKENMRKITNDGINP